MQENSQDNNINNTDNNNIDAVAIQMENIIVTDISQNCIDIIKKYEGCRLTAYLNSGESSYTIGYGHHGKDVKSNETISQEQAERLLIADLQGTKDYVLKHCEYLQLNQNELDALVSFTYNVGIGNLSKLTNNKSRTKEEIANCIENYVNKGTVFENGLTKRRIEEKTLFLSK